MSITVTTDDLAYVRLLIGDDSAIEADHLFTDGQLTILVARAGSCLLGAANALDQIASSEALISKKITTQDLSTDGPAVAAQLRAHATALRQQHAQGSEGADAGWGMAITPGCYCATPRRPEGASW